MVGALGSSATVLIQTNALFVSSTAKQNGGAFSFETTTSQLTIQSSGFQNSISTSGSGGLAYFIGQNNYLYVRASNIDTATSALAGGVFYMSGTLVNLA